MKDRFYYKVAEQIMSTYRDGVQIPCGSKYSDGMTNYIEGFVVMGKPISYGRVERDTHLMSLIIPMVKKKYSISDKDGRMIYGLIQHGIKERVRMRMLIVKLENEIR